MTNVECIGSSPVLLRSEPGSQLMHERHSANTQPDAQAVHPLVLTDSISIPISWQMVAMSSSSSPIPRRATPWVEARARMSRVIAFISTRPPGEGWTRSLKKARVCGLSLEAGR
jgi:hypothetical protein